MQRGKRGTLVLAFFLIFVGVLFLVLTLVPGWNARLSWPLIFFVLSAGFMIPPLVFPKLRIGLSSLFIPGAILATLGLIFTYNVISQDWGSWAYAWLLISSGIGAGLALASWYGHWGKAATLTGIWIMVTSGAVFAFFGFIFGTAIMKMVTAGLLILFGLLLVLRSLRKK
jgi:hypothetical protein